MGSTTRNELVYVKETPGKGCGLFAKETIPAGKIIGMFDGIAKQISVSNALNENREYWVEVCIVDGILFYFDMLDDKTEGVEYINHACKPNCQIDKFMLISTKDYIAADEELTLDYLEITRIPLGIKCMCQPDCKTIF